MTDTTHNTDEDSTDPRQEFFNIIEDGLNPDNDTEILAIGGSMFDDEPELQLE
jgi:hypothetical protein